MGGDALVIRKSSMEKAASCAASPCPELPSTHFTHSKTPWVVTMLILSAYKESKTQGDFLVFPRLDRHGKVEFQVQICSYSKMR
jgi:hypothetical protein